MGRRGFAHRAETFGLDEAQPWAIDALRLLFHVPRAYQPLVDAWEDRHPGTRKALDRLVDAEFVAYQDPVLVDVRTGEPAETRSRRVLRYRATSRGRRLAAAGREDSRVVEDLFPRVSVSNSQGVVRLLEAFDLDVTHARFGLSAPHAIARSGLPERSGRWWVRRLLELGYLRQLDERLADRREIVPAHWRVTRALCRQITDVLDAFPEPWGGLRAEFSLTRSRFLGDINPARIGVSGATDFDHDVETQRILAAMLRSPRFAPGGVFNVEPRLMLEADKGVVPWEFANGGGGDVFYQPDAVLVERHSETDGGGRNRVVSRRSVVEYERFQSRRDGWAHIERFCGWLHTMTLPFEPAVLRFVVDSESRRRGYVELIEAFADYAMDHPERMPANPVTLTVSTAKRVIEAADPLDPRTWFRITLPTGGAGTRRPRLHDKDDSPYNEYFSRRDDQGGPDERTR